MMPVWMFAFVVQTYWRKISIRLRLLFFSYQELTVIRIIKPRSIFTLLPVYTSISTGRQRRVLDWYKAYFLLFSLKNNPDPYPKILTIISAILFWIISAAKLKGSNNSNSSQLIDRIKNNSQSILLYRAVKNQNIKWRAE